MLKFRWSLRYWETLQGKHESRAFLEETALAVHRLGFVPMPPGSVLRATYDEMLAHGRFPELALPHAMAASVTPGNPELVHGHTLTHSQEMMHATPLGVPPVAAGVLRDLHRGGTLNGEGVNIWGEGPAASSDQQRVASSLAGADSSTLRPHSEGSAANHGNVVPVMGQWVSPTASSIPGSKRKAGVTFPEHPQPPFSGAMDAEW